MTTTTVAAVFTVSFAAYSYSKEQFYRISAFGERHGQDFQPDEVFKTSEIFMKHVVSENSTTYIRL